MVPALKRLQDRQYLVLIFAPFDRRANEHWDARLARGSPEAIVLGAGSGGPSSALTNRLRDGGSSELQTLRGFCYTVRAAIEPGGGTSCEENFFLFAPLGFWLSAPLLAIQTCCGHFRAVRKTLPHRALAIARA